MSKVHPFFLKNNVGLDYLSAKHISIMWKEEPRVSACRQAWKIFNILKAILQIAHYGHVV